MGPAVPDPQIRPPPAAPAFLITIDTEGDNLWAASGALTTRNAAFLPRFQQLCEKYGFRPTYLTDFEMAEDTAFQEFGRDVVRRKTAEIGLHLHAWNSPPLAPLTADDLRHRTYLIEYPRPVIQAKIAHLTRLLEDRFGVKITSHRAGRWSFNASYAQELAAQGYLVDCSVTPLVSWRRHPGDPRQKGGTDFSAFPAEAYFLDLEDVRRPGRSPLLEVPVTIRCAGGSAGRFLRRSFANRHRLVLAALQRLVPITWLRPTGRNLDAMLQLVARAREESCEYLEFMLHSSELMPGGSPTFPTPERIELLYRHLEILFEVLATFCRGQTLTEFYWRHKG